MTDEIIVGIDVGTTKICTLVGRVEEQDVINILGVGIEPSVGIKKGVILDLEATTQAIRRSVEQAEQTSGLTVSSAFVSLAGASVQSINSRGMTNVRSGVVSEFDMGRALDQAQAVAIPPDREVIHVIQRSYTLDGQDGIRKPLGMHASRLEVETHIITTSSAMVENLRQCVEDAGVNIVQFVLNPLASAEVILNEADREMGVAICDIGGGTTDVAIYVDGDVWHTMVIPVGGYHVTNDIAHVLRLPFDQAEELKIKHGHALADGVGTEEYIDIKPFGSDVEESISRQEMAMVIEARMTELFEIILQEIKRSGYDGLLPAGLVLTGGASQLPGTLQLARKILDMPVRQARPVNLTGMVDKLSNPSFSTSVGLLNWAVTMNPQMTDGQSSRLRGRHGRQNFLDFIRDWMKRLAP